MNYPDLIGFRISLSKIRTILQWKNSSTEGLPWFQITKKTCVLQNDKKVFSKMTYNIIDFSGMTSPKTSLKYDGIRAKFGAG